MSSSVRSFFKVILSSTLREGKLKLPSKFAKEHWDELSGSVRLFIPVGRSWCVGVERDINKTIWLQDGLLTFLEDNSVGIEYFLIFEYEGNSMFNVLIFDLTATEIDYICNSGSAKWSYDDQIQELDIVEGGCDEGSKKRSIECLAPLTDYRFPQISEEPSIYASRSNRRKCVTRGTDNIKRCNVANVARRKKLKLNAAIEAKGADDYSTPPTGNMGSRSYKKVNETRDDYKGDRKTYNYQDGSNTSKSEHEDTRNSEDGYVSPKEFIEAENMSFPTSFAVTLKDYNLERYILNVPSEFSRPNIPRSACHAKLFDADDNEWVVRLTQRNRSQCSVTKGWINFVRDKKLMVGDVCVFERIRGRDVNLKCRNCKWFEEFIGLELSRRGVYSFRCTDSNNSIMYKDTSRNDGNKSPHSFKVTLKASNIEKHILRVPSHFTPLAAFDSVSLVKLEDADNNEWAVRYINRPRTHAITRGWMNFVQDKKLTVGDICIFERVCKVKLKVSISKSLK